MQLTGHKSLMKLSSGREIYVETHTFITDYLLLHLSHIFFVSFILGVRAKFIVFLSISIFWPLVSKQNFWGQDQHIRKTIFNFMVLGKLAYFFSVGLKYLKTPKLIFTLLTQFMGASFSLLMCLRKCVPFLLGGQFDST